MSSEAAEVYATEALRSFPKLLGLVDRNRLSPTYGCFDRQYWHYKAIDFPSGMAETGALPLALAFAHPFPGGERYHRQPRLAELALAAVRFAARAAHRDGSCDDYFPYERALGATTFSLYALTETCLVLGARDHDLLAFLARRADWVLAHDESGRLANHQALSALALLNTALATGEGRFREGAARRVERVLGWQSNEGWFWEYEGADPGYQSATVDFLAKYAAKSGERRLLDPLARAVEFCRHFVHPDGSYGGGYGSRNTYNVFPAGFELLAPDVPVAGDRILSPGLPAPPARREAAPRPGRTYPILHRGSALCARRARPVHGRVACQGRRPRRLRRRPATLLRPWAHRPAR